MVPTDDAVPVISSATFDDLLRSGSGAVLVELWADGCGSCAAMLPIVAELAVEDCRLQVAQLRLDDAPDVARRFEVMALPTFLLFVDGALAGRLIGAMSKRELRTQLRALLTSDEGHARTTLETPS
jgi:thioredoxin 1